MDLFWTYFAIFTIGIAAFVAGISILIVRSKSKGKSEGGKKPFPTDWLMIFFGIVIASVSAFFLYTLMSTAHSVTSSLDHENVVKLQDHEDREFARCEGDFHVEVDGENVTLTPRLSNESSNITEIHSPNGNKVTVDNNK